jgi:long-subunit acyl-CoA synthetase (AMP-forming)
VQVLVAGLWEGLTVVLADAPKSNGASLLDEVDARAHVSPVPGLHTFTPNNYEGAMLPLPNLRSVRFAPTPSARFLLRTSGTTTGQGKWIALSDANVLANLDSHLPHLSLQEEHSRVLSLLPWRHVFGLVLDLLASLHVGAEIARPRLPQNGGWAKAVCEVGAEMQATHLNAVPLMLERLIATECGRRFLQSLEGGVVGGAPIHANLAAFLRTTRLRVGYGQTEASPGIALGEPGYFPAPNYLGRPLGCEIEISDHNELCFCGPNACLGEWNPLTGLRLLDPERTVSTGDIVRTNGRDLFFAGRTDDTFKLANGKRVESAVYEAAVCQTFEQVSEVLLHSPDGNALELLISTTEPTQTPPTIAQVAPLLGSLGERLQSVCRVSSDFWVRTGKGTRSRYASLQKWNAD